MSRNIVECHTHASIAQNEPIATNELVLHRETNPIEANAKPRFHARNAEMRPIDPARPCKTNPTAHRGALTIRDGRRYGDASVGKTQ